MSDTKETKKKGFFSRLLGGSDVVDAGDNLEKNDEVKASSPSSDNSSDSLSVESNSMKKVSLSKSALAKMKKADIVAAAAELGLDLDIKLTKDKLLVAWDTHFNPEEISEESDKESVIEEVADKSVNEKLEEDTEAKAVSEDQVKEEPEVEAVSDDQIKEEPVEGSLAEAEASVEEEVSEKPKEEILSDSADSAMENSEPEAVTVSMDEKSPAQIIKAFESSQLRDDIPSFRPGDTVVVSVKVKEGERSRLQAFEGVVMNIKNRGLNSSFIVRKISSGIGVERTFQLHSPMIDSIKVKRKGDVRQAKLYYLRERSGRSARIKERLD
tara:strand:- start:4330 stop:5307 length:978 start_codon:yes stop_codon:yes gene_type:complete